MNSRMLQKPPKYTSSHKENIMVTIRTRKRLCIQKKSLDYQGTENTSRETKRIMQELSSSIPTIWDAYRQEISLNS